MSRCRVHCGQESLESAPLYLLAGERVECDSVIQDPCVKICVTTFVNLSSHWLFSRRVHVFSGRRPCMCQEARQGYKIYTGGAESCSRPRVHVSASWLVPPAQHRLASTVDARSLSRPRRLQVEHGAGARHEHGIRTQKVLWHSGQLDFWLELNHLYRQAAWNLW